MFLSLFEMAEAPAPDMSMMEDHTKAKRSITRTPKGKEYDYQRLSGKLSKAISRAKRELTQTKLDQTELHKCLEEITEYGEQMHDLAQQGNLCEESQLLQSAESMRQRLIGSLNMSGKSKTRSKFSKVSKVSKISQSSRVSELKIQYRATQEEHARQRRQEELDRQRKENERRKEEERIKKALHLEGQHENVQEDAYSEGGSFDESSSDLSDFSDVTPAPHLQGQNAESSSDQLLQVMQQLVNKNKLPTPEPSIFTGDPLQYPDWEYSFNCLMENGCVPMEDRIHYLKKYLGGSAKELVQGYFLLRSKNSYEKARKELKRRYGNSIMVAESFRTKLDRWPKIQSKDNLALRAYSDFLTQCSVGVKEVKELKILNDVREIWKVASKLPEYMQHQWTRRMDKIRRKKHRYPKFREFSRFVQKEADLVNDPALHAHSNSKDPAKQSSRPDQKSHSDRQGNRDQHRERPPRRNVFAGSSQPSQVTCIFCKKKGHLMEVCRSFLKKTVQDRRDYVKKSNLCFCCLQDGHIAKRCTNRSTCQKCDKKHPTCLHQEGERKVDAQPVELPEKSEETKATSYSNNRVNKESSCLTTMIVPVYLSTVDNPEHEILVYTLLDTMSDTTFITSGCAQRLNATSTPACLRLLTITSENVNVPCHRYHQLMVRGYKSTKRIALPTAYSRDSIPIDRRHIPTPMTAKQWPHLQKIQDHLVDEQDCPVGVLIGYDCVAALAPLNIIKGEENEPFAVETELGWSIVGGRQPCLYDRIGNSHCIVEEGPTKMSYSYHTSVKDISSEHLVKLIERDFQDNSQADEYMSQDDKLFMQIMKSGVNQRPDGFYQLPLPFKKGIPNLPDNKKAAMTRASSLRQQLLKKPEYREKYTTFMQEILDKNEAEKIPESERKTSPCWYIPHHGVFHPKKPGKLRVVFDCSARYGGTSLNDHLLQGPDLINSLLGVLFRFRLRPFAVTCDIEKMYHQFKLNSEHQNFFRFIWWEGGDLSKEASEYRMKVHIFGATSSPGVANFALKQIATDFQHHSIEAANFSVEKFLCG